MNLRAPNPRLFHIDELIARLSTRLANEFAMGDVTELQLQDLATAIEQIQLRRDDIHRATEAEAAEWASRQQCNAAPAFGKIDTSNLEAYWDREGNQADSLRFASAHFVDAGRLKKAADELLAKIDLGLGTSLETSEAEAVPTPDYQSEAEHLRASLANMTKERDHFREIYLQQQPAAPEPKQWITDPHDMEQGRILNPAWITWNTARVARLATQRDPATSDAMPPLDVACGSDGQHVPHTMDASTWAAEFCRAFKAMPNPDTMLGWFANALMCGHDHGHKAGQTATRKAAEIPFVEFSDDELELILSKSPRSFDGRKNGIQAARYVIHAYRNAMLEFKRRDTATNPQPTEA